MLCPTLSEQQLMKERPDEPDGKAYTKCHPKRKLLLETHKSHEEEQNSRYNPPQHAFSVIGHQGKVAGIVEIQPDKHDQPGQRHHGNKSRKRRHLASDRRADADNAYTNQ